MLDMLIKEQGSMYWGQFYPLNCIYFLIAFFDCQSIPSVSFVTGTAPDRPKWCVRVCTNQNFIYLVFLFGSTQLGLWVTGPVFLISSWYSVLSCSLFSQSAWAKWCGRHTNTMHVLTKSVVSCSFGLECGSYYFAWQWASILAWVALFPQSM